MSRVGGYGWEWVRRTLGSQGGGHLCDLCPTRVLGTRVGHTQAPAPVLVGTVVTRETLRSGPWRSGSLNRGNDAEPRVAGGVV